MVDILFLLVIMFLGRLILIIYNIKRLLYLNITKKQETKLHDQNYLRLKIFFHLSQNDDGFVKPKALNLILLNFQLSFESVPFEIYFKNHLC